MMAYAFTDEEIAYCNVAMSKPAPRAALEVIAEGCVIVEVTEAGRGLVIDTCYGQKLRDRGHKMGLSGGWPLLRAGMIDDAGKVTDKGRAFLALLCTLPNLAGEP